MTGYERNNYEDAIGAYKVYDGGRAWLRIVYADGLDWEVDVSGWENLLDLVNGKDVWRNNNLGVELNAI